MQTKEIISVMLVPSGAVLLMTSNTARCLIQHASRDVFDIFTYKILKEYNKICINICKNYLRCFFLTFYNF